MLDFGHYIAGPLLGMLLSDQGAEVIKIERTEGDPARKLALDADVLIENFRPGVAERLGIGYEELAGLNPGLVYCSLPGLGKNQPDRHRQGWEPLIGAATGLHSQVEGSDEPLYSPLPIASTFAAIAVTMALCARDRTGTGQRVEVPLYDAMFTAMGRHLVKFHEMEDPAPRVQP